MKYILGNKPLLVAAIFLVASAMLFVWYHRGQSQRTSLLQDLRTELAELRQRPQRDALLAQIDSVDVALNQLRANETAAHLRLCSQAMEDAGLTARSVTTQQPEHRDDLVLTPIRFMAYGTVDSVFAALRSEAMSRDGVLVERFSLTQPDARSMDGLLFELDMVLVRPE